MKLLNPGQATITKLAFALQAFNKQSLRVLLIVSYLITEYINRLSLEPIPCSQIQINKQSTIDRPVISFKTDQDSQRPVMNEKGVTRYIKADSTYFKLYWIAVQTLEINHP